MNQRDASATLLRLVANISVNPIRVDGLTCSTCTTPVSSYQRCYTCERHRRDFRSQTFGEQAGIADHVVPLQYAIRGQQSYRDARAYKDPQIPADRNHSLLRMRALASLFRLNHALCIDRHALCPVDAVVTVPSLSRRAQRQHPR